VIVEPEADSALVRDDDDGISTAHEQANGVDAERVDVNRRGRRQVAELVEDGPIASRKTAGLLMDSAI
jgi:hypothetical protein